MAMSELLAYRPPKSAGFGHKSNARDAADAWQETQSFLSLHCIVDAPSIIEVLCWAPSKRTERQIAEQALREARARLGPESGAGAQWFLEPDKLAAALELFFFCEQWPRQQLGPIEVSFLLKLRWREFPDLNKPQSTLGLRFGAQGLFLQPTFVFPFSWDSLDQRAWLEGAAMTAPFRFREEYFKRGVPTKSGGYRSAKIPEGWWKAA